MIISLRPMGLLGPAALCCVLISHAAPVAGAPLGRLFSTPAERQHIDAVRNGLEAAPAAAAANFPAGPAAPMPAGPAANIPAGPGPGPSFPAGPSTSFPAGPATSGPAAATPPPPTEQIVVDGVLRRSTGGNTVWINQQAHDNVRLSGQAGKTAAQLKLRSGQRISLKAGQRYDVEAARVKDTNEP